MSDRRLITRKHLPPMPSLEGVEGEPDANLTTAAVEALGPSPLSASGVAPAGATLPAPPSQPLSDPPQNFADLERTTERNVAILARDVLQRGMLTVLTGVNAGQVFSLDKDVMLIGRGTECDIWLEDPGVSRVHARVVRDEDGEYYVEDMGSTNGTFMKRTAVKRAPLSAGDRLQFGPNMMVSFALVDDAEEELRHRMYEASTRDSLTRVFNRQFLAERLVMEVAYAQRHKTDLSLLMVDIDYFKRLNDTYGHLAGDVVLRAVAATIARLIRAEDVLARYGGEEFVIVARGTGLAQATRFAERVRESVEKLAVELHNETLRVTVSLGVAEITELVPDASADEFIQKADGRLYAAKHAGRNRVVSTG
ncbi:MAG: GGDEF domain-containing protein [Polyangiaceae bacterium]